MPTAPSTPSWRPRDRELLEQYTQWLRDLLRAAPLDLSDIRTLAAQLSRHPFVLPDIVPDVWVEHERYRKGLEKLDAGLRRADVSKSALKRELILIIEREADQAAEELSASSAEDSLGVRETGAHAAGRPRNGGGRPAAGPSGGGMGGGGGAGGGGGGGGGGGARRTVRSSRRKGVRSANGGEHQAAAAPAPTRGNGGAIPSDEENLLLSAEPPATAGAEPGTGAEPPVPAPRWINADIENHDKTKPLEVGTPYSLVFDVDVRAREDQSTVGSTPLDRFSFPDEVQRVELTVQLETSDFDIAGGPQKLTLERSGPSLDQARFQITPRRKGEGKIDAILHREGNFIQRLSLTLQVGVIGTEAQGASLQSVATGRPMNAGANVQPREISFQVEKRDGDYQITLLNPVRRRVSLTINEVQLQEQLEEVRQVLLRIVKQRDAANKLVFQRSLTIDDESNQSALRALAEVGFQLYRHLFFRPGGHPGAQSFGNNLRQLLMGEHCKVQVSSVNFPLPWGLLYLAEKWEPNKPIDPNLFLGMRHIVEQIPLIEVDAWPTWTIPSDKPLLSVSLNVNRGIDAQMKRPFVADQIKYWQSLAGSANQRLKFVVRDSSLTLQQALENAGSDDQLIYFYCHAKTQAVGAPGGSGASSLVLENGKDLTLKELYKVAGSPGTFGSSPLVFINACESAELSPLFYDGFLPYFMIKGARGVIGTECETPALFAAEWARRFFDLFLAGVSIGECMYRLRREFYEKHNNVLGLLYSVYCDGDTQIDPSVLAN